MESSNQLMRLFLTVLAATSLSVVAWDASAAAATINYGVFQERGADHIPGSNIPSRNTTVEYVTVSAGGRQLQDQVQLGGLWLPTSVTWDDQGHVIVTEKAGVLKIFNGWVGNGGTVLLDIQNLVASYGDHGLNSAIVYNGFIWACYMKETAPYLDTCDDYGQMDGRPMSQVQGCKVTGRLSRWPYDAAAGAVTGPEQVVIDGAANNIGCAQFTTHGLTMVIPGPDNYLYVSAGDGAAFTVPDAGQLGSNPCQDPAGYPGAFRAQNPAKINGKILRLDPVSLQWEVYATGFRNPFRLSYYNGMLLESDTGWYTWEEINHVVQGNNYGWPCMEGPGPQPDYDYMQHPVCEWLKSNNMATAPLFTYKHPPDVVGNVMSISALAGWNDRIYYGDYTQSIIASIALDGTDEQLVLRDSNPVGLYAAPVGLIYIDYTRGTVQLVPQAGAPMPSASPSRAAPFVRITSGDPWVPSSGNLVFTGTDNIEGREGAQWKWTVTLLYGCNGDNCNAVVVTTVDGTKTLTIQAPSRGGTLEVKALVTTYAGTAITGVLYYPSAGEQACSCPGERTAGTLDGPAPPSNPTSNVDTKSGTDITKSTGFIGGVIAAGSLVALGIVGAAVWYSGVPAMLGFGTRQAEGVSRRPAGAQTHAATDAAAAAAHVSRNGTHTSKGNLASRRPSFHGAPTVAVGAHDATATASAPARGPTPQEAKGAPASKPAKANHHTPKGEKRV